uniref:Uncharacterized protein n=1 Tax=Timema poppense TaxID=170557 RepID=A0A7R9DWX2_TIMPO|nr:unnamed protein product [Timema poppensis]
MYRVLALSDTSNAIWSRNFQHITNQSPWNIHLVWSSILNREYSSPVASLVLTDSSQLTPDSQYLAVSCELSVSTKEATGLLYAFKHNVFLGMWCLPPEKLIPPYQESRVLIMSSHYRVRESLNSGVMHTVRVSTLDLLNLGQVAHTTVPTSNQSL